MASFGENLRRERELRGVDLRDIAEATNISLRFLQALEQDRADVLPGGIFPKAFVRQYALYLGLDPDRLATEYAYQHGGSVPAAGAVAADRPPSGRLAAIFVGLILVAGIALFFGARGGLFSRHAPPPEPAAEATPDVPLPADRVYPPPPPSTTAAAPGAPITGALVLSLYARQDCWVEAQVDGTTVVSRTITQGETQKLEAESQIVLSVGNAGGIDFTINDRPGLPLGHDGEVKRNIVISKDSVAALLQDPNAAPAATPAAGIAPAAAPPVARSRPAAPPVSTTPPAPVSTAPAPETLPSPGQP